FRLLGKVPIKAPDIPINDLRRLYGLHERSIEDIVLSTLRSGKWLNGPHAKALQSKIETWLNVSACIPVANGTDALELAMQGILQVPGPTGREVITVANAGGYATTACRLNDLLPVYVDIEETSQLISIPSVLSALSSDTALIVTTHLYGGVVDVVKLRAAVDDAGFPGIAILEDCAQAHGARLGDRAVGSLGDIAAFSFYPTKNLGAMGDAGAVVTSDAELAACVSDLHQYGWRMKYRVERAGGRNSRMDEIQAAILEMRLSYLPKSNAERLRILSCYREAAGKSLSIVDGGPGAVVHLAVLRTTARDALRDHLMKRGIATDVHYPILDFDQPGWRHLPMRLAPGGLSVSRRSVQEITTIPCFEGMTEDEIQRIASALRDWCKVP
ncbi:MAG: DegT/DnrJ/EryC1/StrS family aminotransferase, partial [Methylococcales bacterium]